MWYKYCCLLALTITVLPWHIVESRRSCGGVYTSPRGILQTPNFPNPFAVPIECEWVIDAQNFASSLAANAAATSNISITVYLTQVFVFEGLTFTEYQLYGSGYNINGRTIHQVNETNINKVRWVQTYQTYLVIKLSLQTADSTHLRVLDRFLDVYGFNITYEISSTPSVRQPSCTMTDCGFTGICYDHFTKFSCDCFPGYRGAHCSDGPDSRCFTSDGAPTCKNGATCVHVGASAIKCHCPAGFTGHTCETPVLSAANKECENCRLVCPYDGQLKNACKCPAKTGKSAQYSGGDRMGFATTLHLSNLPLLDGNKLKSFIKNQIVRNLRYNHSKSEDVTIAKIVHSMSGADVTFHVFGARKDEKRVTSIVNNWVERGYIGNITVSGRDELLRTALSLQNISINQQGIIRENDEFILSCVARGSPSMTFRWFKDGLLINATSTSFKWTRLISESHILDQYTALLGIEKAHPLDEGIYSCQVEDFGIQHCMSYPVRIGRTPTVRIEPMTITVRKGDNFTIKCFTMDENNNSGVKYTYSWTKNKELLKVRSKTEKYEVLYPYGTILQVYMAEKDVQYSCLAQSETAYGEQEVHVFVVDSENIHTCPKNFHINLLWPETAPDTLSMQECPVDYAGTASRSCTLRDGQRPVWNVPDYSDCTHSSLQRLNYKFLQLKMGFLTTTPENLVQSYLNYMVKTGTSSAVSVTSDKASSTVGWGLGSSKKGLLPGEGARILTLTHNVISYIYNGRVSCNTMNITFTLFSMIDRILMHKYSLINQTHVRSVLEVINDNFVIGGDSLINNQSRFHLEFNTVDLSILNVTRNSTKGEFFIPYWSQRLDNNWYGVRVNGDAYREKQNDKKGRHSTSRDDEVLAAVVFKNLSSFLPPRSFLRLKDGSEMEYSIYSQIVYLWSTSNYSRMYYIDFEHASDDLKNISNNGERWLVKCAFADISTFTYTWDIYDCQTTVINSYRTRCACPSRGIFAILLTTSPLKLVSESYDTKRYILVVGCLLCMMLALFTTACLATSCWMLRKSCLIILKLQCSISIFGTALLFTLAIVTKADQKYYLVLLTALEFFFLLGMSSHLTKLLIVFTELVQLPRPVTSKQTVMGIISGVPIITVFGNHLAYRTMNIRLESWWMLVNSLAFYLYITVSAIIMLLFIFVYITVIRKLKDLVLLHEKHSKTITKRLALLRRSGCLFASVAALSVSSIIYVNLPAELWAIYQFVIVNVLVGLLLVVCYVIKAETDFSSLFNNKNVHKDDKFFSMDSTSSPLNFLTRQDTEVSKSGSSSIKMDYKRGPYGRGSSTESRLNESLSKSPGGISATFESCLHTSTSFCDGQDNNMAGCNSEDLECYNSSPQHVRKLNQTNCSPDILSSKVCVELDLVASLQNIKNPDDLIDQAQCSSSSQIYIQKQPKIVITPDEAISKILEQEGEKARSQPDGHEKLIVEELQRQQSETEGDNLDGMLDRISHDLDYLLNRSEVLSVVPGRRISKPPSLNIMHQIVEEEDNTPEAIDIIRTNC